MASLMAIGSVLAQHDPIVQLSTGALRGQTCNTSPATSFLGIPYAQPPTGELRFMPPQPLSLNTSQAGVVFEATHVAPPCIQWGSEFDVENPTPSEDCLYLNVYVPPDTTNTSSLPVKVWAYGGGNIGGAASYPLYDACSLATDAIVVTFNYRLGPLGFLALDSAGIQGNMAIQDYLAALSWVKENIVSFGGNSSQVLLLGQSAGADDAFVVSTLPEAKSLISAAIFESGGGQDIVPYDIAQLSGSSFAETLNCSTNDLICLQSKSADELIQAFQTTPALAPGFGNGLSVGSNFAINTPNTTSLSGTVLDGEIIKKQPLEVGSQVPIIAGSNEFDATLFVLPIYLTSDQPLAEENYTSFLAQWGPASSAISQQYPLSLFESAGSTTTEAVVAAITHIVTQSSYTCSTYKALRAASAAGTQAYAYRFNHTPSCPWLWESGTAFPSPDVADFFLSTHTAELPFVFGNLVNQPWGNGSCNATAAEFALSHALTAAWTAMAVRGNPSVEGQSWPLFDACQTRGLWFQESGETTQLDFSECEFWDEVFADLGGVNMSWPDANCAANSTTGGSKCSSKGRI
ncbi:hypothetical protein PFICI_03735 [Pestalotiopsis fici W106-1]|uniref:Carboxylic ester hydrolase n=1 Tax=Pestalotiopsis fici (strain W106-1 / CGMCC3.15140) TaxID=1229662 RepID=W3XI62_PESFW|nr:uncharacterized protein PFICI_03735 [Pestalotiopsis fici W106-1]ETS85710.1 hypothetical protein PFICI_03735 [Pestalotiopsis fici W106-1]